MRLMGKFILNDLLSEGTVYTLDGQNIFDNQYFSFIGMTDDSFYCSTNVPDDKVIEFPRNVPVMNRDLLESAPMVEPEKQVLDVTNVSVPKEQIDSALNSSMDSSSSEMIENNSSNDFKQDDFSKLSTDDFVTIHDDKKEEPDKVPEEESLEEKFSIPAISTKEVSLPEVMPDSIFSFDSGKTDSIVSDEKEESNIISFKVVEDDLNKNSIVSQDSNFDNEAMGEDFGDVITAVSGMARDYQHLKEENKNLQTSAQKSEEQEAEIARLKQQIEDQKQEISQLKHANFQLVTGYRQIRKALGTNSEKESAVSYQKAA